MTCYHYETCGTEIECLRKDLASERRHTRNLENVIFRGMLMALEEGEDNGK